MKSYSSTLLSKLTLLLQMEFNKLPKNKKWFLPLVFSLILSIFLIIFTIYSSNGILNFPQTTKIPPKKPEFVETQLHISPISKNPIPRIAYLVSGSSGDGESLKRTLKALYHPLNQYVVHLDLEASLAERMDLMKFVREEPVFARFGNVRVIVRANLITYRGPTMVTNTLHAASILLKEGGEWDWFINLSASDYPLVTQDDLLHTLSTIPRHLNFIEHTSDIGWKEYHRAKPIIIDPGLYSLRKSDVYWVSQKRSLPSKFRLFTGVCNLCNGGVKFVRDNDQQRKIRFEALQSESGKNLLRRSGRTPDDISSVVLVEKDRSYIKSDAVLKIMEYINLPFPQLAFFLQFIPLFVRDFVYENVANNRYMIFGRSESCEL